MSVVHRVEFFKWKPSAILSLSYNARCSDLAVSRADSSLEIWGLLPFLHCRFVSPPFSPSSQALRRLVWISPTRLVAAGWSAELVEWDVSAPLAPASSSASFGGPVWDLAVAPDAATVAAACEDGGLRLFDVANGLALRRNLPTGSVRVLCCAFSPQNPDIIVCGDAKGRLQVWNVVEGRQLRKISVSGARVQTPVWSCCVLPDGTVATGDSIGYTQLWDAEAGQLLHSFKTHVSSVLTIVAAGTGLFASGVDSRVVRIERAETGEFVVTGSGRPTEHDVVGLAVAGSTLVSASLDGSLSLYGLATFGTKQPKYIRPYPTFHRPVVSVAPPARLLCCRTESSVQLFRLGKPAPGAGNDKDLASGAKLRLGRPAQPLVEIRPDVNLPLHWAQVAPDGEVVLMGSREGVRGYAVEVGPDGLASVARLELPAALSRVKATGVCFAASVPDAPTQVFALATYSGDVALYSLVDFQLVASVPFHRGRVVTVMALQGALLASVDDQRRVAVHRSDSGELVLELPPFDLAVTALAFHPTNPWLLVATLSDQIFAFDCVKKQHTPWSVNVGDRTDTKLVEGAAPRSSRTCVLGFAFGEKMLCWGNTYVNALDMNDVKKRNVQHIDRFADVLSIVNLTQKELVVVERPWKDVLVDIPQPLQRHRYVV